MDNGYRVIHRVVSCNQLQVAKVLHAAGADIDAPRDPTKCTGPQGAHEHNRPMHLVCGANFQGTEARHKRALTCPAPPN